MRRRVDRLSASAALVGFLIACCATAGMPARGTAAPSSPPEAITEADRTDLDADLAARRDARVSDAGAPRRLRGGRPPPRPLRSCPPTERIESGPRLARELQIVLDRSLWVDLDALSELPEGLEDDGLPPGRDRLGTIGARGGPVDAAAGAGPGGRGRTGLAGLRVHRQAYPGAVRAVRLPALRRASPPRVRRLGRPRHGPLAVDRADRARARRLAARVPRGLGDPAPRALLRAPHGDRARRPDRRIRPPPAAAHGDALPLPRRLLLAPPRRARPGASSSASPAGSRSCSSPGSACGSSTS